MPAVANQVPESLLAQAWRAFKRSDFVAAMDLACADHGSAGALDRPRRIDAGMLACECMFRLSRLEALIDFAPQVLPDLLPSPVAADVQELHQEDRCRLLRWMTLAYAETARFEQGIATAREFCALADATGDDAMQALALSTMAVVFDRMGDPWQGERLMLDALQHAERQDALRPKMLTLNNLAAVTIGAFHLYRDVDDAEARAALERALGHARRAQRLAATVADTYFHVFIDGNLGEALLMLGDSAAGRPLLEKTLQWALDNGQQAQSWRIRCTLAEGLLADGEHAAVDAAMSALQDEAGGALPLSTLLRVHQLRSRANLALGRHAEACAHLQAGERLQRRQAIAQLRAQSTLLVTRSEVDRARTQVRAAQASADAEARSARLDALTGLANRRSVDERLPVLLQRASALGLPLSLALVDADHFKRVNDRHGHRRGDEVLVTLARLLRHNLRRYLRELQAGTAPLAVPMAAPAAAGALRSEAETDLIARLGGEEFLVVLPDTTTAQALKTLERLRRRIETHPWDQLVRGLQVTVSIGVVHAQPHGPEHDAAQLIELADNALYRAKHAGRNRVMESNGTLGPISPQI